MWCWGFSVLPARCVCVCVCVFVSVCVWLIQPRTPPGPEPHQVPNPTVPQIPPDPARPRTPPGPKSHQAPNPPGWNPSGREEQLNLPLLAHPAGESGWTTTAQNLSGDRCPNAWSRFILGFAELTPCCAVGHCLLPCSQSWPPFFWLLQKGQGCV